MNYCYYVVVAKKNSPFVIKNGFPFNQSRRIKKPLRDDDILSVKFITLDRNMVGMGSSGEAKDSTLLDGC